MLQAGVSKIDITADNAKLIKDRLYAKALVLSDGVKTTVIVTMDVTAIGARTISDGILADVSDDFLQKLRSRVESELEFPGTCVMVNASHTHPPGTLLCNDEQQVDRVLKIIRDAAKNIEPVKIGWGSGWENGISINRTLRLKNGMHWTIRHSNPCPSDEDVSGLGPIDPEIGIIRIDRLNGTTLAVIYNFACHLLFGDEKGSITANIPAYASKIIEESFGNGTIALFLQGAAGDVVDIYFKDFSRPRDIEMLGTMLGLSTLGATRAIATGNADLNLISKTVRLPRRTDFAERIGILEQRKKELLANFRCTTLNFKAFLPLYLKFSCGGSYPLDYSYNYIRAQANDSGKMTDMDALSRSNVQKYLQNMKAMEELARIEDDIATLLKHKKINEDSGETTIAAEVMGIRIGDCAIITAPIELLTEIGLRIKNNSYFKPTLTSAYTNGYMHYGAPASYYDKQGYEVTECLLGPGWQYIYENAVDEIIQKL